MLGSHPPPPPARQEGQPQPKTPSQHGDQGGGGGGLGKWASVPSPPAKQFSSRLDSVDFWPFTVAWTRGGGGYRHRTEVHKVCAAEACVSVPELRAPAVMGTHDCLVVPTPQPPIPERRIPPLERQTLTCPREYQRAHAFSSDGIPPAPTCAWVKGAVAGSVGDRGC